MLLSCLLELTTVQLYSLLWPLKEQCFTEKGLLECTLHYHMP